MDLLPSNLNHHTRVVVHGGNEAAMDYYSAETEALGFMLSWDMLLDNGIILQAWHGYHSSYNGCSDRCLATSHWLHGLVYGPFSQQLKETGQRWKYHTHLFTYI